MVRGSGHCSLNALPIEILDTSKDKGRVVDGVDLDSGQGQRPLPWPVRTLYELLRTLETGQPRTTRARPCNPG